MQCNLFNCSLDYLLGKSDIRNPEKLNTNVNENLDITKLNDENKQIIQATYKGLLAKQDLEKQINNFKRKNQN